MTTIHLVRPELRPFLDVMPGTTMSAESLPARRNIPLPPPTETPNLEVTEVRFAGPSGAPDVRALVYRPTNAKAAMPAILHIHGGGYVMGNPEMSDLDNRRVASELGCVIVSVDYRLSPETPHPGPVEDCYAGLKWLYAQARALGVDTTRIAIKGESAGGGMAAGLALLARDRGEVPVAFQCLTYPMIDDRPAAEPHPYTGEFVWSPASNHFGWASYLGHEPGGAGVSPYAAAARAETLEGLPATLIVTGALDLFLEENLEYARRLTRAGVPLELIVYQGAFHGFQIAADSAIAQRYRRDVSAALSAAFEAPV